MFFSIIAVLALCLIVKATISDGCEIGVHVVLGSGACHLKQNVVVHAGAKIIGSITIGEGSVVAANAVVINDMPSGCLIAGVPAIVKQTDIDISLHKQRTVKLT